MDIEQKIEITGKINTLLKSRKLTLGEAHQISSSVSSKIIQKIIKVGENQPSEDCK